MRSLILITAVWLIVSGCVGDDGKDGLDGKDGEPGAPGVTGLEGAKGDKGEDGEPGPQGALGARGENGEPGPAGEEGESGEQGEPGEPGESAFDLLTDSESAPAEDCSTGGQLIKIGLDNGDGDGTARDGELQDDEVDTTIPICNGASGGLDGFTTLVSVTDASAEDCPTGGKRINIGLDDGAGDGTPRDAVLHDDEIDTSFNICNGIQGETGPQGEPGEQGPPGSLDDYRQLEWVDAEGTLVSEIPPQIVGPEAVGPVYPATVTYFDSNGYAWRIDPMTLELSAFQYPYDPRFSSTTVYGYYFEGEDCSGQQLLLGPLKVNVVFRTSIAESTDPMSIIDKTYVLLDQSAGIDSTISCQSMLLNAPEYCMTCFTDWELTYVRLQDLQEITTLPEVPPYVAPLHQELR